LLIGLLASTRNSLCFHQISIDDNDDDDEKQVEHDFIIISNITKSKERDTVSKASSNSNIKHIKKNSKLFRVFKRKF
jgi:hypothetical protein